MHSSFPVPMIGGEIHYGRVQSRYWPAILDSTKQLGVEVVGMYVMWDYHELREGAYDFAQLHAFLAEVERRGLKVLARPGPFFYAEWRNLGIPDHAVPFGKPHPEFRRKAAHWIAAVLAELRPYCGRTIIAMQADNEIDPMPHFWGEDQGFAAWLQKRYRTIGELNQAWGAEYRGFDEPIPWLAAQIAQNASQRVSDSCQYRYDLATEYAQWVIGEYRQNGCTLPILLNTWPGVDAQHWRDLSDLADFYGIDPYPTSECRSDYRYFRERLRLLRCVTDFPYIAEFGSGIWHGMPNRDYTPTHYRLTALAALAAGVRGWNWYMLVNRDNWYGAPINERGVIHPELGEAFADAIRDFKSLADAPPPAVSFGVTWSWRYNQLAQIAKRDVDDPLPAVLHEMGIEYDWIDVDRPIGSDGRKPPAMLLLCGEISEPRHVWSYVEAGGHLVLFQRLLAECAPADGTSHPNPENLEVSLPGGPAFRTDGAVFAYRTPPGRPIVAKQLPWRVDEDQRRLMELAVGRSYTCGYSQPRGQGTVTVLGCRPSRAAILALHQWLGIEIPALPLTPGVHAARRGDRLIVLNCGEARTAELSASGRSVHVSLPRCGGAIVAVT
ncbi:MAG: beta-galactosidase [Planctomycetes bacterium]|nr:beta-galactosidase [Planctomycetota bacterium]